VLLQCVAVCCSVLLQSVSVRVLRRETNLSYPFLCVASVLLCAAVCSCSVLRCVAVCTHTHTHTLARTHVHAHSRAHACTHIYQGSHLHPLRMRQVARMHEKCICAHIYVSHTYICICVTHIYMWEMYMCHTHIYLSHTYESWHVNMTHRFIRECCTHRVMSRGHDSYVVMSSHVTRDTQRDRTTWRISFLYAWMRHVVWYKRVTSQNMSESWHTI